MINIADFIHDPRKYLLQIEVSGQLDTITSGLQTHFLDLVARGTREEAIKTILHVSREANFSQRIQLICIDALQWLSQGKFDPIITPAVITLSEGTSFTFCLYLESVLAGDQQPFVLGAFLPKSGGTFISKVLKENLGLSDQISFVAGATEGLVHNYLIEQRVSVIKDFGGVFSHIHLAPNSWNMGMIKKHGLPFWLHLRDPRDCFLSALNMIDLEVTRISRTGNSFYQEIKENFSDEIFSKDFDVRAICYFPVFVEYCKWISKWVKFTYKSKVTTYHSQLLNNPINFCADLRDSFDLDLPLECFRPNIGNNYGNSRFHVGTNGRWMNRFGPSIIEKFEETMDSTGISTLTW